MRKDIYYTRQHYQSFFVRGKNNQEKILTNQDSSILHTQKVTNETNSPPTI